MNQLFCKCPFCERTFDRLDRVEAGAVDIPIDGHKRTACAKCVQRLGLIPGPPVMPVSPNGPSGNGHLNREIAP